MGVYDIRGCSIDSDESYSIRAYPVIARSRSPPPPCRGRGTITAKDRVVDRHIARVFVKMKSIGTVG